MVNNPLLRPYLSWGYLGTMGAPVDLFHDPKVGESFSKSAGGAC